MSGKVRQPKIDAITIEPCRQQLTSLEQKTEMKVTKLQFPSNLHNVTMYM